MLDPITIKFGEPVWHDQSYLHSQLRQQASKDFYNRDDQKFRLEMVLRSVSRKPAIIIGERRSGKTSLLRLLADHLAADTSGQFIPILIPWQGIKSRDELVKEILHGTLAQIDEVQRDANQITPFRYAPSTISEFIQAMRQLLANTPEKTVVICIDEFDSILEEAATEEQDRILGLAHVLLEMTELPVNLLLTMSRIPLIPEVRSSPLIAKAEQVRLHPFSWTDFEEMVIHLAGEDLHHFSNEDLKRLFELSGGWPYFAKLLLSCLAELPPDEAWLEQAIARACNDPGVEQTISNIYTMHFDEFEKIMMLLLAERNGRVSAEEIAVVGISLKTAAAQLVKRGFVSESKGGSYSFRIGFLEEWFRRWVKYKLEVERRLIETEVLHRLERLQDPWAYSTPTVVYENE